MSVFDFFTFTESPPTTSLKSCCYCFSTWTRLPRLNTSSCTLAHFLQSGWCVSSPSMPLSRYPPHKIKDIHIHQQKCQCTAILLQSNSMYYYYSIAEKLTTIISINLPILPLTFITPRNVVSHLCSQSLSPHCIQSVEVQRWQDFLSPRSSIFGFDCSVDYTDSQTLPNRLAQCTPWHSARTHMDSTCACASFSPLRW